MKVQNESLKFQLDRTTKDIEQLNQITDELLALSLQ